MSFGGFCSVPMVKNDDTGYWVGWDGYDYCREVGNGIFFDIIEIDNTIMMIILLILEQRHFRVEGAPYWKPNPDIRPIPRGKCMV